MLAEAAFMIPITNLCEQLRAQVSSLWVHQDQTLSSSYTALILNMYFTSQKHKDSQVKHVQKSITSPLMQK